MSARALAGALGLSEAGLWILAAVGGVLGGAALVRWTAARRTDGGRARRAWRSVVTWWALFAILLLILVSGRLGALIVTAIVSLLLLSETLRLVDRSRLMPVLGPAVVLLHLWAWLDWVTVFTQALPLLVVAMVSWELLLRTGVLSGVLTRRPTAHHAILIAMIGPVYAFGVAALPAPETSPESEMGWFLLLIILTELNDMAQSWWGKAFGSSSLAPELSPRKTWEGLLGGVATTCAAAVVLGPTLTSWGRGEPPRLAAGMPAWSWSLAMGLVVALCGVAGDLAASSLKRRAGRKDAGSLLPGHGGVLDRFDSITVTAPVFFLLTWTSWFWTP